MIQRIQTVFLVVALFIIAVLIWIPPGEIAANEKIYSFYLKGIVDTLTGQTIYPALYLIVFAGIIILLQLIIIFSYKKRPLQMRMSVINILLMLGFMIVCWLFVKTSAKSMGDGIYSFKITAFFPLISIFFNYLAYRSIRQDEALVKSVDRIR
jgi:hypothetical protein